MAHDKDEGSDDDRGSAFSCSRCAGDFGALSLMVEKPMSLYINNTWVRKDGRYWIAKAIAFSENGNDVAISSCHGTPELAYKRLVSGMKELGLVPADWDE